MGRNGNELRVGHPERDQAITLLGEHLSAGRLDVGEFDDRCARVAAARFRSDLHRLFEDLPEPRPADSTPQVRQPRRGGGVLLVTGAAVLLVFLVVVAKQAWLIPLFLVGGVVWFTRRRP